jgi:hypothetical protein
MPKEGDDGSSAESAADQLGEDDRNKEEAVEALKTGLKGEQNSNGNRNHHDIRTYRAGSEFVGGLPRRQRTGPCRT